jgi:uncharacterized membrane protein
LPASFYSIASSGEQQRSSRSLFLVVAAVVGVAAVALIAAVVALVAVAAPLLQLNSASIFYASLRRLSASRPTTSCLAAA